ncbi:MAG: multidrug efflux pump subunit AcrA (membrane-fusion protein) [Candidatus Paceibacteria bacterium]|jgi:multidrug efflux pump subunit AcrA (membrane-fusion protein)
MKLFKKYKKTIIILGSLFLLIILIFIIRSGQSNGETVPTFAVVHTVETGIVSSGIEATGTIIAAQKLNLDVYKQQQRIESVNVVNGGSVDAGQNILSFDKSRANVNVQSSQVKISQARLDLNQVQENLNDPDIGIRSLDQQIEDIRISLVQAEEDKIDAYTDFLNTDLALEPVNRNGRGSNIPSVTGYYNNDREGEYQIEVYSSSSDSGHSVRYTGLYSGTETIFMDKPIELADSGIELVFSGDIENTEWILALPNVYASSYSRNKEDYEEAIVDLGKEIQSLETDLTNALQSRDDESFSDGQDFRSLRVRQAESALSQARVELSENIDVVQDQNIIAPFSGTIEGLENVVVGATPTRDTNDPISFGTLISDDFLVTFSLSAVDVAKTSVGQTVVVDVTSFKNIPSLESTITEISSLPQSDSVAQYEVQALITLPNDSNISLREGLLADIQIVQEEVKDVIRIPKSSVRYEKGKAFVDVLDTLSETQQQDLDTLGIIRSETGEFPSYPLEIVTGIDGVFYTEVISGLDIGTQIITTQNDEETGVVQQSDFRGRPRDDNEGGRPQ